jgi:hypothetical protein
VKERKKKKIEKKLVIYKKKIIKIKIMLTVAPIKSKTKRQNKYNDNIPIHI